MPNFDQHPAHEETRSPPSSPAAFPWELEQQQQQISSDRASSPPPVHSAFTVLGKRKATTDSTENARPTKKGTAMRKKSSTDYTQMQISLGQKMQAKCKQCGMEYVPSAAEDRKLHDKFHKQNTQGYVLPKDFVKKTEAHKVFDGITAGDAIVQIDGDDSAARHKTGYAVLEIVQKELGAAPISKNEDDWLWGEHAWERHALKAEPVLKAFMYVRGSKCVGFLLVENIAFAQAVAPAPRPSSSGSDSEPDLPKSRKEQSALSALKARKEMAAEEASRAASEPIHLNPKRVEAAMGISRVWTSPAHRGQRIAQALMHTAIESNNRRVDEYETRQAMGKANWDDEVREAVGRTERIASPYTRIVDKADQVAFSQPTEAGAALARKWFGKTYGWLVYKLYLDEAW